MKRSLARFSTRKHGGLYAKTAFIISHVTSNFHFNLFISSFSQVESISYVYVREGESREN